MATKTRLSSFASFCLGVPLALVGNACADDAVGPTPSGFGAAGAGAPAGSASAGAAAMGGGATGSAITAAGGAATSAGAPASGSGSAGAAMGGSSGGPNGASDGGSSAGHDGESGGGGAGGPSNTAGNAGAVSQGGGSATIPAGCKVSSPVSFKADIGPWLNTSCGKGKGSGCHVTDDASTVNSACPDGTNKCGFNHAYDWITAGSHNQFCKQTPGPIRYTVVMDVTRGANPASCTNTRVMPPDGPRLTECQTAALAAWLAEPMVLQLHRADDTSPTAPYLMPPFN